MAFDGALLNRPSDSGGERAVSDGLFVLYTGVVAAPPGEAVLSPNGDGVGDVQPLAYKVGRPSTVKVSLVGPGPVDAGARREREGARRPALLVGRQRTPTARRRPRVSGACPSRRPRRAARRPPPTASSRSTARSAGSRSRPRSYASGAGGRLTASFTLTRPARLTGSLRTRSGAVVATFARAVQAQAGPNALRWNGRVGKRWISSGQYLVRIRAVSTVGASELEAPVTIRRVAPARAPKRG